MAEVNPTSPPHLTPPLTEEDLLDWLRLLRSRRVGISTFFRLMRTHGSAAASLEALPQIARDAGVENYKVCPISFVEAELDRAKIAGITPVTIGSPDYPENLTNISDAPPILWCLGDVKLLKAPTVALVGARNASSLGTRMARRLARELGEAGIIVASGMARGVDTAAHLEALDKGTIAILAGGVDVVYPAENATLAQEIAERGLRISEQPTGHRPHARDFPRRNRLISGLSSAVVVVEAAARSGSLITARTALDQGREVLAVPGHPFDARADGCNMLLRDGAQLVRHVDDILEVLKLEEPTQNTSEPDAKREAPPSTIAQSNALHKRILERLGPSPIAEDQLIRDIGAPAREVSPEIVTLEMEGKIHRAPGGLLSRAS